MEMIQEAAYWAGVGFCMASGGMVGLSVMVYIMDTMTLIVRKLKQHV